MAGRRKIFNEEEVIGKASKVFWKTGFEASSAEEILAAMGIGQGSFYNTFKGGKLELYERSLYQFTKEFEKEFLEDMLRADDGIGNIKRFFISLASESIESRMFGCYLGNAMVQLTEKEMAVKKIAIGLLKRVEQIFVKVIEKAQKNGRMKNLTDAKLLGRYLINLWNGIYMTRRMGYTTEQLRALIELNLEILK
ncbi:MAG TPA: TetR/AcrR family transcriptional regulator [Puia sp.]|nr:TetR/AcrR family transcriptional regulator [Puia sp.]